MTEVKMTVVFMAVKRTLLITIIRMGEDETDEEEERRKKKKRLVS